jgi:hypothetical protein
MCEHAWAGCDMSLTCSLPCWFHQEVTAWSSDRVVIQTADVGEAALYTVHPSRRAYS